MANRNLVVVESAAKARTIEKYLGRGYVVRACLGHVRDLPTSRLGVDVEQGFQPQYVVPKDRKEIVKRLKDEARGARSILLATDPDREGEAIAWHLVEALGLEGSDLVSRIEFHEITRGAILEAMKHPRKIDSQRVDAQQARRVLDRLIGYPVSNFLGRKVRRGLSAGRVQSVAVRIVVDRERQIEAFTPVEYWSLEAELAKQAGASQSFVAALVEREGEKISLHTGEETRAVQEHLAAAAWSVADVKEREQQRHPAAPFTTSTLQQEASRKLNFGAKRTMVLAQRLYEGVDVGEGEAVGLITYMRTDSVNVAESAQDEAREYISRTYGGEMVPATRRAYRTRSRLAQEAHEAIRPTSVFRDPESMQPFLDRDQSRLYDLVWKRFVASQMASAVFDVTTVQVDGRAANQPAYRFRATGSRLKFRGFLSVYLEGRDDDDVQDEERQPLPALTAGEPLNLLGLKPEQHWTQPPPRYTEATLVKALEEHGIGRPSTYAPTLSTVQERGYVDRDGKALKPTELGITVNDLLVSQFGDIVDVDFTATMEERLDEVAQGKQAWAPIVEAFYRPLTIDLERAEAEVERLTPASVPTDEVCSLGHPMVIKEGRFGRFIACSLYPEHKETRPLAAELPPGAPEEHCTHNEVMQLRTGRYGPFYTSTHDCGETKPYAPRVGVDCPTCGGDIVEKHSKKGRTFYGCNRWPACEWVSWYRPIQEPCAECGGMQIEMGRGGLRCLKHEGPPPSFASRKRDSESEATSNGKAPPARRPPARTRRTKTATRSSTAARARKSPSARGTARPRRAKAPAAANPG